MTKNQSIHHHDDSNALHTELPSLIGVANARNTREDMYHYFWFSHQAREGARNEIKTRLSMSARLPTSTSAHHAQHLHEHQFKLPTTLNAYFEFGSRTKEMNHRPRPMAIVLTLLKVGQDSVDILAKKPLGPLSRNFFKGRRPMQLLPRI